MRAIFKMFLLLLLRGCLLKTALVRAPIGLRIGGHYDIRRAIAPLGTNRGRG